MTRSGRRWRAVRDWLDGKLGEESRHALGAKRMVSWGCLDRNRVKRKEGARLMGLVEGIIEGTGDGSPSRYAMNWGRQREMTKETLGRAEGEDWKDEPGGSLCFCRMGKFP
jgi:hypothetical protein